MKTYKNTFEALLDYVSTQNNKNYLKGYRLGIKQNKNLTMTQKKTIETVTYQQIGKIKGDKNTKRSI